MTNFLRATNTMGE